MYIDRIKPDERNDEPAARAGADRRRAFCQADWVLAEGSPVLRQRKALLAGGAGMSAWQVEFTSDFWHLC